MDVVNKIMDLKKERKAVILAHNYQPPEIQDVADFIGDSLELAQRASKIDADVIVFCGVRFMAESAAILSPEKTVLLPEWTAGCPMAEMIEPQDVVKLRERYPDAEVVCYVNSTAAVKAVSDVCCTSSNAVKVVNSCKSNKIIFIPDKNLGSYVSRFTDKEIILWEGYCPTHHKVLASDVKKIKEKKETPFVIVHPECRPEVIDLADEVASTSGIIKIATTIPNKNIIIGTEMGLIYRLKKTNPYKNYYLLSPRLICPNMKKTTLETVYRSLKDMQHVIKVDEDIRREAVKSLNRMLKLTYQNIL